MKKTILTATAFAAIISASALSYAQDMGGMKGHEMMGDMKGKAAMEKCYGVVKAGKNDCASAGANSCAGTSKTNGDAHAWVMVPQGLCDKLTGGTTAPKQ